MAAIDGATGWTSFAELVAAVPQPIPEMMLLPRLLKVLDGEVYFQFLREEIIKSAESFRFSVVLKFLKQRPSLDVVRCFIHNHWGLSTTPVVSSMRRLRNVFVCMANEVDFTKALSRDVCEINGSFYRVFRWTPEFIEDDEPSRVPVWLSLLGLPPNFYSEAFLTILMAPIGTFIRRDNPTRCATRTDGARLCVEVDEAKEPLSHFWIGAPGLPLSRKQQVVYETPPAYCCKCRMQGHNKSTCRVEKGGKLGKVRVDRKEGSDMGASGASTEGQVTVPLVENDPISDCGDQKCTETVNGEISGGEPEGEISGAVVVGKTVDVVLSAVELDPSAAGSDPSIMEQVLIETEVEKVLIENEVEKVNDNVIVVMENMVLLSTGHEEQGTSGQMGPQKESVSVAMEGCSEN
ncbi:hypothetical protein F2P56_013109 [Juglans regia]|uniref:DUF4283 domain-containing protein n=2 Tax=Juglans regia TaxID=51240 RepID=A0A833XNF4_JUGRE|nr:uncharacterized protein LOC108984197 [Juglans regia]KAF5469004.1 hypothetical protein F2P56_013109 [Juglans regia]